MGMPSGDSREKVNEYYLYLQGHHQTDGRVATWHVDWLSLAWLWGFLAVMAVALFLWVSQYRTTRHRAAGIYPVDRWGGYTSELARPATRFFLLLTAMLTAFALTILVGHLIWGQKF
jgi:hypothetical protein